MTLRQRALYRRPFAFGRCDNLLRLGGERGTRLRAIKEIEPLAEHQPKHWMAWNRRAACDPDRGIAAETRTVAVRPAGESGAITFIAEAPGDALAGVFDARTALFRRCLGEIGDRIEAADRQAALRVDRDRLAGGGDKPAGHGQSRRYQRREKPGSGLSGMPCSGHSSHRGSTD